MAEDEFRVTYIGPASRASAVAQSLTESGLSPDWIAPVEKKSFETAAEGVTVYYFCKGTDAAVHAAIVKIRERLQGRATIEIELRAPKPKRR